MGFGSKVMLAVSTSTMGLASAGLAQTTPTQPTIPSPAPTAPEAAESEIVVTGIRASLTNSLEAKRVANQVIDVISAESVGKLPDPNVADALQRVPGVQITRNFGQGSRVVVRGLQSVRIEVDGRASYGTALESTNGFNDSVGRNFGLESLSSNLFSKIEVFKTPTADQVEGGLGGVINARTNKPFDFTKPTVVISAEGSTGSRLGKLGYTASGFATTRLADDRLGILIGATYTDEPVYLTGLARGDWAETSTVIDANADGKRDIRPVNVRSERFQDVRRKRLGLSGGLQFKATDDLTLYVDTTYSRLVIDRNVVDALVNVPTGAVVTNPVFNGNYVVAGTVTQPFNTTSNFRTEKVTTQTSGIGAEFKRDRLAINVEVATTSSKFAQDNIVTAVSTAAPVAASFDFRGNFPTLTLPAADLARIQLPASYGPISGANGFVQETYVRTKENAARIDAELSFDGSFLRSIKAGARVAKLSQDRNQLRYTIGAVNRNNAAALTNVGAAGVVTGLPSSATDIYQNVSAFHYPGFLTDFVVANFDAVKNRDPRLFTASALINNPTQFYDNSETTYAGYVQANLESEVFGTPFRGNVGVRVVKTEVDTNAIAFTTTAGVLTQTPVQYRRSYTDVLPSANLAFNLTDKLVFRLAAGKVLARQALDQNGLAPNLVIAINPVTPDLGTATSGNPFLDPTRLTNFDATLEWYFSRSGFISANVFYKKAKGFPVRITRNTLVPGLESLGPINYTTPVNSDPATIKGLELSYQQNYDFLPGFLGGLGAIASFTYVDASTDLSYPSGTTIYKLSNTPLTGVSKYAYNLTGFYEKGGFNFRLSYVWRSSRLYALQSQGNGPNGTFDATNTGVRYQFIRAAGSLDASASYDLTSQVNVFANASNLLPKKSAPYYYTGAEQFQWRHDIGESRFTVGVRAKF